MRASDGSGATNAVVNGQGASSRFPPQLMHAAATMYYLQDATQAEIADRLGTSRPTVSRLLADARRLGIVRIEVVAPTQTDDADLAAQTAAALSLDTVHLAPFSASTMMGASLAPALSRALTAVGLQAGDVLLVSSGRTVYEVAQNDLPSLPGVQVVPTVGGQDEPEAWYQTNEITRHVAARVSGTPTFLYAPALPGPGLHDVLVEEPSFQRIVGLWDTARCAILGIGAPPLQRESIPGFVPTDAASLQDAVGDVCSRFFDAAGEAVAWPGSDRLVATSLDSLRRTPVTIGVAIGQSKVPAIMAAARGGYVTQLVTDAPTAAAIVDAAQAAQAAHLAETPSQPAATPSSTSRAPRTATARPAVARAATSVAAKGTRARRKASHADS